jgi:hypothetical protein
MSYMTFKTLTTKQKDLLRIVSNGGGRHGIYALSAALDRPYRRVYDNVKLMEEQGYVRLTPVERNGKSALAVTPAVTGAVMTTVNVSLPRWVTAKDLLAGLKASRPLTTREQTALTTFFADVPAPLSVRFLNEHGISLEQAAAAYRKHVMPQQRNRNAEAWLYVE